MIIRSRDPEQLRVAESVEWASILLLQDGVYLASAKIKANVYASAADSARRGVKLGGAHPVGYAEIVGLLLEQGHTVINL